MRWQNANLHLVILITFFLTGCARFSAFIQADNLSESAEIEQNEPYQLFAAEQALYNLTFWQLSGRITIKSKQDAWSGTLRWRQQNDHFVIHFNAPLGQGAIRIFGDRDGVELQMADGTSFEAEDIDTLLSDATGWELPLSALKYWILGVPNKNDTARIRRNEEFQIEEIRQSDWTVAVKRYQEVGGDRLLPKKLVLQSSQLNLRIIVGEWQVGETSMADATVATLAPTNSHPI